MYIQQVELKLCIEYVLPTDKYGNGNGNGNAIPLLKRSLHDRDNEKKLLAAKMWETL